MSHGQHCDDIPIRPKRKILQAVRFPRCDNDRHFALIRPNRIRSLSDRCASQDRLVGQLRQFSQHNQRLNLSRISCRAAAIRAATTLSLGRRAAARHSYPPRGSHGHEWRTLGSLEMQWPSLKKCLTCLAGVAWAGLPAKASPSVGSPPSSQKADERRPYSSARERMERIDV